MARIRTIKPEFFTDEDIAALPPLYRLAFQGLWCHADREGRLEDRPTRLKVQVLPYDDLDMDQVLTELAQRGFIVRYEVAGRRLIQIRTFDRHQCPNVREPESTIPAPCRNDTGTNSHPGNGREGNGMDSSPEAATARRSEPDASRVVLEFPTVGTHGHVWSLTDQQIATWKAAYPSMDILAEARKALAWVRANPGRRKTASGMPRFLVSWLNRANDRRPTEGAIGSANGEHRPSGPRTKGLAETAAKYLNSGIKAS